MVQPREVVQGGSACCQHTPAAAQSRHQERREITANREPIHDEPPEAETGKSDFARYFEAREKLAAAEARYGIQASDSPLQPRSAPDDSETDTDRVQRWMREAADKAAAKLTSVDAVAALGTLSPEQQRAALARARTSAASPPSPVDRELERLDEALNQRAASSAAFARTAFTRQQAAEKADRVSIPPDVLRTAVPPGWIACECPGRHPNAGLFIDGQRWHSASLTCEMVY